MLEIMKKSTRHIQSERKLQSSIVSFNQTIVTNSFAPPSGRAHDISRKAMRSKLLSAQNMHRLATTTQQKVGQYNFITHIKTISHSSIIKIIALAFKTETMQVDLLQYSAAVLNHQPHKQSVRTI
jgi:hypothetical protein